MQTFDAAELYTVSDFTSEVTFADPSHPNGHRVMLCISKNGVIASKNDADLYFKDGVLYLGYIGFLEKFQGGTLKLLHPHCIKTLSKYGYTKILLKPLSDVLTLWIYFGFVFIEKIEEIKTRYLLIDYLRSLHIISDIDIPKYDKMLLVDIVKLHKEAFKSKDFPKLIDKKLYYTNLEKRIAS